MPLGKEFILDKFEKNSHKTYSSLKISWLHQASGSRTDTPSRPRPADRFSLAASILIEFQQLIRLIRTLLHQFSAPVFLGREEYKKKKQLEEDRKAGKAPLETDENGAPINPHIPSFIAQAPCESFHSVAETFEPPLGPRPRTISRSSTHLAPRHRRAQPPPARAPRPSLPPQGISRAAVLLTSV